MLFSFLLNTLGQMYVDPTKAAIICSLESLVGAAGGYIVLGEVLTPIEFVGCMIMLASGLYCSYNISYEASEDEEDPDKDDTFVDEDMDKGLLNSDDTTREHTSSSTTPLLKGVTTLSVNYSTLSPVDSSR